MSTSTLRRVVASNYYNGRNGSHCPHASWLGAPVRSSCTHKGAKNLHGIFIFHFSCMPNGFGAQQFGRIRSSHLALFNMMLSLWYYLCHQTNEHDNDATKKQLRPSALHWPSGHLHPLHHLSSAADGHKVWAMEQRWMAHWSIFTSCLSNSFHKCTSLSSIWKQQQE